MLDWTDRHCRYFHRLLTPHALLYTEMVTTGALLHGDAPRYLQFNQEEHPVALQLGGCEPQAMAACAKLAQEWGYDEVNINVGCPSERARSGAFGACLMAEPQTVADCVSAMRDAVDIPVTIKSRTGIDTMDDYRNLHDFVGRVAEAGCETFIVHARKAWLKGLSPRENRDVPPLVYDSVYRVKSAYPHLHISINGGVITEAQVRRHLRKVDGVMLGREAYRNPYILVELERALFDQTHRLTRHQVVETLLPYIEKQLSQGVHLKHITRHILGLFQGLPGARKWRRCLSEHAHESDSGIELVEMAARLVPQYTTSDH